MRRSPLPWIISFSLCIYRWLMTIGPADFRREYARLTLQTFRQYCKDAYQLHGTWGVIRTWPSLFSEAVTGMLAERFAMPVYLQEYNERTFRSMRRSMVTVFCAFVLFAAAYIDLQHTEGSVTRSVDLLHTYEDIRLLFTIVKYSTNVAFLTLALCGLPLLFIVSKHAITNASNHQLLLFLTTAGQVLTFFPIIMRIIVASLGYSITVNIAISNANSLIQPSLEAALSFIFLADILLLIIITLYIGAVAPTLSIPRRDFSATLLYFARIPMLITTLAMGMAFIGTALWVTRLWIIASQLSTDAIAVSSNISLFVFIFLTMAFSCGLAASAIRGDGRFSQPG